MKNKFEIYLNSFTKNFKFLGKLMSLIYSLLAILILILIISFYFFITEFLGMIVSLFIMLETPSYGISFLIGLVSEIIILAIIAFKVNVVPKFRLVEKEMDTINISNKNMGSFKFSYKTELGEFEQIKTDCANLKELLEEIKIFMTANKYNSLDIKIYNRTEEIGKCKIDSFTDEKLFIKNIKYVLDEKEEYRRLYE